MTTTATGVQYDGAGAALADRPGGTARRARSAQVARCGKTDTKVKLPGRDCPVSLLGSRMSSLIGELRSIYGAAARWR